MIVCAMGPSERHIEDIYVAKMYCASSFKRNRFVQGQIAGKSLCFCWSTRYRNRAQPDAAEPLRVVSVPFLPKPPYRRSSEAGRQRTGRSGGRRPAIRAITLANPRPTTGDARGGASAPSRGAVPLLVLGGSPRTRRPALFTRAVLSRCQSLIGIYPRGPPQGRPLLQSVRSCTAISSKPGKSRGLSR